MTHSRPAVRDLLATRGLAPRRELGQNFVADPNTVRRIAALARVGAGDRVVEVGAGLGSLTLALIETGAHVTAVEVDAGLATALRDVVADHPAVTVVEADAMRLDWDALIGDEPSVLVANLPYNVATPLLCDLLDGVAGIVRMLVMVQREVGERLAARPRTPAYGAVSVKVAYWADARIVGLVPASVFVPRPKVESALVEIVRHEPAARRPDQHVHARAHGVRSAAQDAARHARRARDPRAVRRRRRGPDGAPGGARRGGLVPPGPIARLTAPAKLTWSLRVVGVRPDGYHLLDAEMLTLDLADELTIGERDDGRSSLTVDGPFADGVPTDDSNLVHRALRAAGRGADVHVIKRIPNGGGLGGGSADAAAVLRWAGIDDPLAAVAVGADVPFCVVGGRARVSGIGEVVEPLDPVERTVTLVVPPVHVSTPAVYRAWDAAHTEVGAAQRPRAGGPRGGAGARRGGGTASPS